MANYSKAYTEVLEIMTYLPEEEQRKIPVERIEFYFENRDKEYDFHYDETIPFDEQKILPETQAIIVTLFRDYFATDEQKEKLEEILKHNEIIEQRAIDEKFYYEDIFHHDDNYNRINDNKESGETQENTEIEINEKSIENANSLSEIKHNFFKDLIQKIKGLFKRNKSDE